MQTKLVIFNGPAYATVPSVAVVGALHEATPVGAVSDDVSVAVTPAQFKHPFQVPDDN